MRLMSILLILGSLGAAEPALEFSCDVGGEMDALPSKRGTRPFMLQLRVADGTMNTGAAMLTRPGMGFTGGKHDRAIDLQVADGGKPGPVAVIHPNQVREVTAGSWTLAMWVRMGDTPPDKSRLLDHLAILSFEKGALRLAAGNTGFTAKKDPGVAAVGAWTFIACSFERGDSTTQAYLYAANGKDALRELGAGALSLAKPGKEAPLCIGNAYAGGRRLPAMIDQVRLWSEALSPDALGAIHAADAAKLPAGARQADF